MILVSEIGSYLFVFYHRAGKCRDSSRYDVIGDKTFLIAAIMATRHPRMTVFGGAFASLMVMSILSAAMGRVILGLIPAVSTHE